MSKFFTLKLKLIFPPLVVALTACIIAMSLAWYNGSLNDTSKASVSLVTAKNEQQEGTSATITTIADSYDIVEGNYSVVNTGTIAGYTGQTGNSKQNAADRAYIIFYKVTLVNDDPKELEAYDYAYIKECIITWPNSSTDRMEEYIYGTATDSALTHFQCLFLRKKDLVSGKYTFSSSNSLIIDERGADNQVTFYIGLQFYNPNLGQDFFFSSTKYISSKFALTLQFEKSSNMAFFYTSIRDASTDSSIEANGYKSNFDLSTGSEDQKYRLVKVPQVDFDTADNPGGEYGSLISTYEVSSPLYLEARTTVKVYNTLSKFFINDYANNDYKIFKYCYDYIGDSAGNYTYYTNDDGYPIRTSGYYKIRLRVYESGYKIWVEYPDDITNFYLKGGYNAWGDNEFEKRNQVYYSYKYLYALHDNKLYRVNQIYANTNGTPASTVDFSDMNNINFFMYSNPDYEKVDNPTLADYEAGKYLVSDDIGGYFLPTEPFDENNSYFIPKTQGGSFFQVTKLYNNWGQEITSPLYKQVNIGDTSNPLYRYDQVTTVDLTNGHFEENYYYKIDAYNADNTPTYEYLNTVLFDDAVDDGHYVTNVLNGVATEENIYYEKDGTKHLLTALWFNYNFEEQNVNSNYDNTSGVKKTFFSNVTLTRSNDSWVTVLSDDETIATLIEPRSEIDDATDFVTLDKLYYKANDGSYVEFSAATLTLIVKMKVTKQIGFETKGEFLAFNSNELYFKDNGANFLVEPGVYEITLDYDLSTGEGKLTYKLLYTFNEKTLDIWYVRGSFDASWGILPEYKLDILDAKNGLYQIQDIYFAKKTAWKISNASWSPSYNKFKVTNNDGVDYIGTTDDGNGGYNLVINVSGLYSFVLDINADLITITYRGAYVGDNTRETYWYLYNKDAPSISEANNFTRENLSVSNICTLKNVYLKKGENYVLLYNAKPSVEYSSGYFDNSGANGNWQKYFEIVLDDENKPMAKVLTSGFYDFTITSSKLGDQTTYTLKYDCNESQFGPASLYLRGAMTNWDANDTSILTAHLMSNYAYFLADVSANQEFKIASSGWDIKITDFYFVDAREVLKEIKYSNTDIENLVISLAEGYPNGPSSAVNMTFAGVSIADDSSSLTLVSTTGGGDPNTICPDNGKVLLISYLNEATGVKTGYMIYIG